jgi:hypothetical protein
MTLSHAGELNTEVDLRDAEVMRHDKLVVVFLGTSIIRCDCVLPPRSPSQNPVQNSSCRFWVLEALTLPTRENSVRADSYSRWQRCVGYLS